MSRDSGVSQASANSALMDNRPRISTPDHPGESIIDGPVKGMSWRQYENMGGTVGDDFPTETKGVSGVDYDAKMSETYVSMDEYSRKCVPKGRTESEDLSKATWHCVRTLLCCFIIITLLALIAGLGGLGIGLYHFLTVSLSDSQSPNSSTSATTGATTTLLNSLTNLEAQLRVSMATIDRLSTMVEQLQHNLTTANANSQVRIDQLDIQVSNLSDVVSEQIANPPTVSTMETTIATNRFQEIALYQNCTTTTLSSCVVQNTLRSLTIPSFGLCSTTAVPLNVDGMYNLNLYCAISEPGTEQNPLLVTLDIDQTGNSVRCFCYVIVNNSDVPRSSPVQCALYATRCPTNFHLNTTEF